MDSAFKVLLQREIYDFLEGSAYTDLVTYDGSSYGMPYQTAGDLDIICRKFGITDPLGGSRWTYVETLLQFAIEHDRCEEVLSYFFSLEQFTNLQQIPDIEDIEKVHLQIVTAAIKKINEIIRLSRKELHLIDGHFYIVDVGTKPAIQAPHIDMITVAYIRGLRERCEQDFLAANFDSVLTKSRTLIEETLIHILEQNSIKPVENGKVGDLYNQVKQLRNMQQNSEYDKRVNGLLSGLEKIVQNIGDMRNINSDAHGVGSNRIRIREKEARLVMNSAISFCEYLL